MSECAFIKTVFYSSPPCKDSASHPSLTGLQLWICIQKHYARALNDRWFNISHSFARKWYMSVLSTIYQLQKTTVLEGSQRPDEHVCPFKYICFKYTFGIFLFSCFTVSNTPASSIVSSILPFILSFLHLAGLCGSSPTDSARWEFACSALHLIHGTNIKRP